MRKQIAFSVSAGAYVYQMGVGYYLQRHYDLQDCFFSGASGGAWVALLLAAGKDIKVAFDIMLSVAHRLFDGRLLGSYWIYDKAIEESFHLIFQGQDVPSLVNGRLAIVVTRLCWSSTELFKQEIIDHWTSNEDVLQCVIASALIPYALNGKPFVKYRGWHCLDGGVTNIEGINQAWALAHKRTASLMQANGEGYLRSLEEMVDGLVDTDPSTGSSRSNALVQSETSSTMWHAVRWVPFAGYVSKLVAQQTSPVSCKVPACHGSGDACSARPPTHLIGFVGSVAKLTVGIVAEQVTYPVHATIRTVAGVQRTAWHLTQSVYHTTGGVAVQLHETLPLKSLRDRMLSLVMTKDTAMVIGDAISGVEHGARETEPETHDEEAAPDAHETDSATTQTLHDRMRHSIEAMLTPWQLGRAASHTLTLKLKSAAVQLTTSMFSLLSMPEFSLNESADVQAAQGCADILQEVVVDIEIADGESVAVSTPEDDLPGDAGLPRVESSPSLTTMAAPIASTKPPLRSVVSDTSAMMDSRSIAPRDGHTFDHTAFWGEHNREFVIKSLPNGGKRLELAPWSWRKHDILTYHLSADLAVNRKLFGLGILDAEAHHWEIHEFFE